MKKVFAVTAVIVLLGMGLAAQANITVPTVPVGDAGNTGDYRYGRSYEGGPASFGSVGYAYNIGKYEVTAGQYTAFLNAVAASDGHALYNTNMTEPSFGSGITRNGDPGSYTYSVATDFINRPVNCVSWGDCARFANWLHNGQPTGLQDASTTEDGAYYLNDAMTGDALNAVTREADWRWAITSEDEWYKAAYYKGGSANSGYWQFPTCHDTSDEWPGRDMADASGNNANINIYPGAVPIDSGKYTTVAGEFQNSDSAYGTFDQGGNVFEWNEALVVYNDYNDWPSRLLRGGSWDNGSSYLQARIRLVQHDDMYGAYGDPSVGFRVVCLPEPSSLIALGALLTPLLALRRRKA